MAWKNVKTRVIGIAIALIVTTTLVFLWLHSRSRTGWLLDGSTIVLEKATFGKEHASPMEPTLLSQFLPKKWLNYLHWNPGKARTSKQTNDFFVFWLKL